MAKSDVTIVMEKYSKEDKAARGSDSDSKSYPDFETTTGEPSLKGYRLISWKMIFVTSCVFAVLLDPLFLYAPVLNKDMNCLRLDMNQNLKMTALILRSLTDVFYVMDIIVQIYACDISSSLSAFRRTSKWGTFIRTIFQMIWQSHILIDILAILPFPQVLILKMRGSKFLYTRKFVVNFFVLMQYIPRVLRIYLSCKEPKNSLKNPKGETPLWVKGVLNFFMYILASHVLGALWYFFAIQRLTTCWQYALQNENGGDSSAFGCQDRTFRNTTSLEDSCPISPPDPTVFDFGIFLSVLQSGVPWSTNFAQKFSNCFCWGLRNLSAFGSNLQPSAYTWENLFVVFISVIGLLLFIYLIGNLQTYLSLDTARIEAYRFEMKKKRKMKEKGREVESWLSKNGIPEKFSKDVKRQIMERVEQLFVEKRDVDLDNILSVLPLELEEKIKSFMPLTKLKKLRVLQDMEEQVLKAICRHLKPTKYSKSTVIIQENEPLQTMLIVEGEVTIRKKGGSVLKQTAGDVCGDDLLAWPFSRTFPQTLPRATESAIAIGDVEALILMASDMKSVGSDFLVHFNKKFSRLRQNMINFETHADPTPASVQGAATFKAAPISMQAAPKPQPKAAPKPPPKAAPKPPPPAPISAPRPPPPAPMAPPSAPKPPPPAPMVPSKAAPMAPSMPAPISMQDAPKPSQKPKPAGAAPPKPKEPEKAKPPPPEKPKEPEKPKPPPPAPVLVPEWAKAAAPIYRQDAPISVGTTADTFETQPKDFTEKELRKATNNFDPGNIIGEGAHGIVYKGRLPDNTVVTIKKPKRGYQFQSEIFVNEALVLSQIRHKNVVRFLGCCLETKMPMMVYEFINNGTLYEHIHQESNAYPKLSLELRIRIAAEIAGALAYLHYKSIIHKDVTTTNILLDERYTAKLSDFGAAESLHEDLDELDTSVNGTLGYLDPEYLATNKKTEKSDVFSFGVVLMELLTSRPPISAGEGSLINLFVRSERDARLNEIVDGELREEESIETIYKVCDLAVRCVNLKGEERPSMEQVATELERIRRSIATTSRTRV